MNEITLLANAKLNLYLDITGKREDGYHLLETVMQSVDLCDIITIKPGGEGIRVSCSDPGIPCDSGNICHKAASLYAEGSGARFGAEIHIDKRIPHGAGLGGGSADAAAVLVGLDRLFGGAVSAERLMKMASRVGADVPFCMEGGVKLCRGIGDELHEINPLPKRYYLVVMPDLRCITKDAYMRWDSADNSGLGYSRVRANGGAEAFLNSGERFAERLYNVFAELYGDDRIGAVIGRLKELGAEGAGLTGSGAAMFGVFADEKTAANAAKSFPKFFTSVCKPASRGIIIL